MAQEQDLRSQVDRNLASATSDREWAYLKDKGYFAELQDEAYSPSDIAKIVQELRMAFSDTNRRREVSAPAPVRQPRGLREEALSVMLAATAAQDTHVRRFRAEVLGGNLLRWDEIASWLRQRRTEGGEGVENWLTNVYVPDDQFEQVNLALAGAYEALPQDHDYVPRLYEQEYDAQPFRMEVVLDARHFERHLVMRLLRCLVPNTETSGEEMLELATGTGTLERLRRLGERLAERYGWDEAEAVRFILTGIPPRVAPITVEVQVDEKVPTKSRITMVIDPTLSPREVAEYYRHTRNLVLGSKYRELKEKALQLAQFTASQVQEPSTTWAERMRIWNQDHPEWSYHLDTNFGRDCKNAKKRLLSPDFHVPTYYDYEDHDARDDTEAVSKTPDGQP